MSEFLSPTNPERRYEATPLEHGAHLEFHKSNLETAQKTREQLARRAALAEAVEASENGGEIISERKHIDIIGQYVVAMRKDHLSQSDFEQTA